MNTVEPRPELDRATLIAAKAGDRLAFDSLVRFYERRIYNYLYRFTRQQQDTEDLTQDVFIKVYRALSVYDPTKKFSTWLYTIATNHVYDWLRKKRRGRELLIIDDPDNRFETIDKKMTYKVVETRLDIEAALDQLRPIYRAVILLFYQQGLSYEEISQVQHLPVNTVKTYIHRAKQELRLFIEGEKQL